MEQAERIVVIGAGIGGLATALALADSGCDVLLIERDEAPPALTADTAFETWERPGVPQFRMAHSLLARLQTILRTRHPQVLRALAEVGVEACPIELVVPSTQIDRYRPKPADIDLRHLLGRRATFEYVLRQQVQALPRVRFMHGARVEGFRFESHGAHTRVCGVAVARGAQRELVDADIVVDASGGRARVAEWLRAHDLAIETEVHDADFAYMCRHYRSLDGAQPLRRTGGALDYLWFGAFFAERGHFSLAFACPSAESRLIETMRRPAGFDAVARRLPGISQLIDNAEAVSKVLGYGGLTNRWTRYVLDGRPALLGFFAVGDSHMQTNPMYGRGCAAAFVQAHALCDALRESRDPVTRADLYSDKVWAQLRPQYEFCVGADKLFTSRGQRARGEDMPRAMRSADYLTDQVWAPAVLSSPLVAREAVKTLQMQEMSGAWVRIAAIASMLLVWARRGFGTHELVPERSGPARSELLKTLPPIDDVHPTP